ncbi:MAG: EamA family transporter [Pseudomonadota bacterium]
MEQTGGTWRMVLAMALSGTIGVFVLISGQSPQTVVWYRCLLGGAALLAWLAWRGGWKRLDRRAWAWLVLGGVALIANWLCLFAAYQRSSISLATVIYQMQPFILLLLTALVRRELPAWHKLPWLGLALLGVALAAGLAPAHLTLGGGAVLALAAAFWYAVFTLATRQLGAYAPAQIAGLQLMLGVVVLAPLANWSLAAMPARAWGSLLVLGLVHTGLVYNLMYAAFQRLRAPAIANLSFLYPLVAVAADWLCFGTQLTALQLAGMGVILASVLASERAPFQVASRLIRSEL